MRQTKKERIDKNKDQDAKRSNRNSKSKQSRTNQTQILTRHRTMGFSNENPMPLFPNPVTMITHMNILGPTLYLCCFLVWSCLGKTMSSASKQSNKRKWAEGSCRFNYPNEHMKRGPACNADNPDSVVFPLSIGTRKNQKKRKCET